MARAQHQSTIHIKLSVVYFHDSLLYPDDPPVCVHSSARSSAATSFLPKDVPVCACATSWYPLRRWQSNLRPGRRVIDAQFIPATKRGIYSG